MQFFESGNMIVFRDTQNKVLAALQSVAGIVERRHTLPILANGLSRKTGCGITNGFPEAGGGGAAAMDADTEATGGDGAPAEASDDDDDGGDGDGDPDRRRGPSTFSPSFAPALLAFAPLSHYVSFGRSRIYQLISAGEFPKPIKVGKSSRWRKAEIDQWIARQSNQIGG